MPSRTIERREFDPNTSQIETLCGVARTHYRDIQLYFGWTPDEKPMLVTDERFLTPKAIRDYKMMVASNSRAIRLVDFEGQLQAAKFERLVKLADYPDKPTYKTQDILIMEITDGRGLKKPIEITEIDFLEALQASCLSWEVYNPKSLMAGNEVAPTLRMFTLILPDIAHDNSYGLLFKSSVENESSESAFKLFLRRSLRYLIENDSSKPVEEQKGYLKAMMRQAIGTEAKGGLAYKLMKLVNDAYIELPQDYLEKIRRESAGKGLMSQGVLLLRELFVEDSETRLGDSQDTQGIGSMDVDQLIKYAKVAYEMVRKNF